MKDELKNGEKKPKTKTKKETEKMKQKKEKETGKRANRKKNLESHLNGPAHSRPGGVRGALLRPRYAEHRNRAAHPLRAATRRAGVPSGPIDPLHMQFTDRFFDFGI